MTTAPNTIIAIFLLISGCNFGLHFAVLSGRSLTIYWRDPEFRVFIGFQIVLIIICTLVLIYHSVYDSLLQTFDQAFFQVVSVATTAGFSTVGFANWPLFLPITSFARTYKALKIAKIMFYPQDVR